MESTVENVSDTAIRNRCAVVYRRKSLTTVGNYEPANFVFSPVSVSIGLGMLYGGARSDTAEEMKDVMHFDKDPHLFFEKLIASLNDSNEAAIMKMATKLYVRKGYEVTNSYKNLLKESYKSDIQEISMDDPGRRVINSFVEELVGYPAPQLCLLAKLSQMMKDSCMGDTQQVRKLSRCLPVVGLQCLLQGRVIKLRRTTGAWLVFQAFISFLEATVPIIGSALGHSVRAKRGIDVSDGIGCLLLDSEVIKKKQANLLLRVLDELTSLVLLNAIYFKGSWEMPFLPEKTRTSHFRVTEKETVPVSMMFISEIFPFGRDKYLKCKYVKLSYVGNELEMLFVRPDEVDGWKKLGENITGGIIAKWSREGELTELDLYLPRFKVERDIPMKKILRELWALYSAHNLQQMGLRKIFSERADLSEVDGKKDLHVSDAFHKAFIEVNEDGTEGAPAPGERLGCHPRYPPLPASAKLLVPHTLPSKSLATLF
ncbi:unnamed protein product [Darwinula stevensoni]|uniref:Serpin domain-containing protein n=1 Tax=Darwinula stevensoni TaxID=69355 RepID=A0A7R8X6E8_9CRUS|nr:unnamed protein product [Darwinula stevensoni]CAG0882022.1 unnamed protein product [Darwinula stevensoni]